MAIINEWTMVFITLAIIFGFYMTWGIGANDVANAMGTSVGSGAITVKQAIIIAAIFEFAGAFLAGGQVTATIRGGIIQPAAVEGSPELLVYGMLSSLLAAAIWLMVASQRGWPVSTTHTIVGAIVGFAVAGIGINSVQWVKIAAIASSWLLSPLLGGILALLLMLSIRWLILNTERPFDQARKWGPLYVFLVGFTTSLFTLFQGLDHLKITLSGLESLAVSILIGLILAFIGHRMIQRIQINDDADRHSHFASVEKAFVPMMIFTACAMAFAHGSNDVANGIGPMAAVLSIIGSGGKVVQSSHLPLWVLLLGGAGIVIGLATMGYKVMQTLGTKITELTPTRGYCATLASAMTVVLASKTGMPISTTHVVVGAVIGVGLARGIGALDLRVLGNIFVSWLVTLPIGGLLSAAIFFIFKFTFG